MEKNQKIYVTQPFLPPLEEFSPYLSEIWESKWLTNQGKFHREFEKALCEYLHVKYISLFANGTLALITALQVLRITGEVITTPYSFVATTHALWWNKIQPVFVDIDENCNIHPERIETAITPKTTAILPVHVYGNPCDVQRIQEIADTYGLRVIYDACHAFGVKLNGNSILNFGDLSVLSFHATKVFTTFEGGAIVCQDEATKKRIDFLKNFGFAGETTVVAPGINAKMNEFQAALGLLQLKHFEDVVRRRREITQSYRKYLQGIKGIRFIGASPAVTYNFAYFPIFIDEKTFGASRDVLYEKLKEQNVYSRRYFFPLISQFPTYKGLSSSSAENLPNAEKITTQVICLPIYPSLEDPQIKKVCQIILENK